MKYLILWQLQFIPLIDTNCIILSTPETVFQIWGLVKLKKQNEKKDKVLNDRNCVPYFLKTLFTFSFIVVVWQKLLFWKGLQWLYSIIIIIMWRVRNTLWIHPRVDKNKRMRRQAYDIDHGLNHE